MLELMCTIKKQHIRFTTKSAVYIVPYRHTSFPDRSKNSEIVIFSDHYKALKRADYFLLIITG